MAKDISAGNAFVTVGAKLAPLNKALKVANDKINATGKNFIKVGGQISAAGVAMLAPFALAAKKFSSAGDEIAKMSRRTGVATETLSEWAYAAQLSGADAGVLEKALRGMARNMFDASRGTGEMMDAMKRLGIDYATLEKLSPEEQFLTIGDALRDVEDPSIKAGIAMKVFGRAGSQLIPLFDEGSKRIKEMGKDAENLGITLGGRSAANAEILTDAMFRVEQSLLGVTLTIGNSIAPVITKASDALTKIVIVGKNFIKNNQEIAQSALLVGAALAATGTTIAAMGTVLIGISLILPAVTALFSGLAVILSPVGIAVGIATAAIFVLGDAVLELFNIPNLGLAEWIGTWEILGISIGEYITLGVLNAQKELGKVLNTAELIVRKTKVVLSRLASGTTSEASINAQRELNKALERVKINEEKITAEYEKRAILIANAIQERKKDPEKEPTSKIGKRIDDITKKVTDIKDKLKAAFDEVNLPQAADFGKLDGIEFVVPKVDVDTKEIIKKAPSGKTVTGSFSGAAAFSANSKVEDKIQKDQLGELVAIRTAVEQPQLARA